MVGVVRLPKVPISQGVRLSVTHDHHNGVNGCAQFLGDKLG